MNDQLRKHKYAGIYLIIDLKNNKRYVGQSINIHNRIQEHIRNREGSVSYENVKPIFRSATPVERMIYKYGLSNLDWCVLEKVSDPKMLNRKERYWIKVLRTSNKKYGYNVSKAPYRRRLKKSSLVK